MHIMFLNLILYIIVPIISKHEHRPQMKALMAEPAEAKYETPSSILPSREEDQFWEELKRNCIGCWSGGIIYTKYQNGHLAPVGDKINMRLKVDIPDESSHRGQWTLWNMREEGDTLNIPIRKHNPGKNMSMHKIWFEKILLRASNGGEVATELGFWDKDGDGMRRTVIVQYKDSNERHTQHENMSVHERCDQTLNDVCILQQKLKGSNGFVGDIAVSEEANILSEKMGKGHISITKGLESMKIVKSESVQIPSMERTTIELSHEESNTVTQTVIAQMNDVREGDEERFTQTLPNGIVVSLPTIARKNPILYFSHQYQDGKAVVLEMQYQNHVEAHKAILHTFELL
jgi:hypothetical protein